MMILNLKLNFTQYTNALKDFFKYNILCQHKISFMHKQPELSTSSPTC